MVFKSMDLSNGELLLNLVELKNGTEVFKNRGYGRHTERVLDDVELSFLLSDVTPIEAIALKDLSTDFLITECKYLNLKDDGVNTPLQITDDYKDIQSQTIRLFEHLSNEYDEFVGMKIGYPLMSIRYEVRVTFKGSSIIQLYGYEFERFFDFSPEANSVISEDAVRSVTMTCLYRFIREMLNYNDPLSDAITYGRYDNIPNSETSNVILESIIGPNGLYIPFISDGNIDMEKKYNELKDVIKIEPTGVRYRFLCRSTLDTFLQIYLFQRLKTYKFSDSKNIIKDYGTFLTLLGDPSFYVPSKFMEKHSIRIDKLIGAMKVEGQTIQSEERTAKSDVSLQPGIVEAKSNDNSNEKDTLQQFYYILNNAVISYTIEICSDDLCDQHNITTYPDIGMPNELNKIENKICDIIELIHQISVS